MARSTLAQVQRDSYKVSRAAGDLNALSRGPLVYAKRIARRRATRTVFRLFK